MSKAIAQLRGRDFVVPRDVQEVFIYTVAHRLILTARAETEGITAEAVLQQILAHVAAPKLR
jgi:MoxR-like ATPase